MASKDRSGSKTETQESPRPAIAPSATQDETLGHPANESQPRPDDDLGDLTDLDGVGGDGKTITIYRIDESGRKSPPGFTGLPAYVLKLTGVFDLDDVKSRIGGGHYLAMVKDSSGRLEGRKRRFVIDGDPITPRRELAPGPDVAPELVQVREQLAELRTLITQSHSRPREESQLSAMREMMQLAREFAPAAAPAGTITSAREVLELARELADDGGDGSSMGAVLRESLPRLFDFLENRSSATPALPGAKPVSSSSRQAPVLIELLVRAIGKGSDPAALADAAEEILLEQELVQLRLATPEQVLAGLKAAESRYPILAEPSSIEFVKAFLEQLKTPAAESE